MEMVTFDTKSVVGVDWTLLRILALLARFVADLHWRVDELEFSPSPAAEHAEKRLRDGLTGLELLSAIALDPQLIEGTLIGASDDGSHIRISAVDGQHWDIQTNLQEVVRILSASIDLREIPS